MTRDLTVAVVGLGYVGLPLAVEFGKKFRTIGYDLSEQDCCLSAMRRSDWRGVSGESAVRLLS